jgi:hypothetical protein
VKEEMILLSSILQTSTIAPPSTELDERVMKSFQKHHARKVSRWRQIIFGSLAVPKPVFATLLISAVVASWLAFQIGKINSTIVSMTAPRVAANETPTQTPDETSVRVVEFPVIKEKIITRTVYVREPKNNRNEKNKSSAGTRQNYLPLSSSVADNGYFTDVNLKGFEPSAEINAKIIKEVKEDEK